MLLRGKGPADECVGVIVGASQYDGTSTTRWELGLRCGNGSCKAVGTGEPVDVDGRTTRTATTGGAHRHRPHRHRRHRSWQLSQRSCR